MFWLERWNYYFSGFSHRVPLLNYNGKLDGSSLAGHVLLKGLENDFCQKNSDSTLWQVQSSDRNSWGWCNKVVLCINVYNDLSLSIDRECQCPSLQGELSKILFITSHLACEIMMPDRLTVQNCSTWNVQKGMISLAARLGLLIGFNLIIICMSNCWRFKLPYSWRSLEWSFAECQHVLWWSEQKVRVESSAHTCKDPKIKYGKTTYPIPQFTVCPQVLVQTVTLNMNIQQSQMTFNMLIIQL